MESKSTLCYLSEKTVRTIPPGAGYVSLCIKGATMPISCAADVLTWVCKKALLYDPKRVHQVMKALKTKWLKASLLWMEKPYGISFDCYVDLACSDDTALRRAILVMKWLGWKPEDVSITYTDSPVTSITTAPLPPPATPTLPKPIVLKVPPVIVAPTPPKLKPIPPKPVPPKPVQSTTSLGEEIGTYNLADLQDPKDLFGKRVVRITVEGCDYDVLSWRRCFNVFLKHCFDYHQHELTRFNWSHKWPHEVWPLVKRIYPGPTRYEIVPTNEKDSKRLVTAMEMIRRGCNIPSSCVRVTCAMKMQKDSPLPPAPLPSPTPTNPPIGVSIFGVSKKPKSPSPVEECVHTFSFKFDQVDQIVGTIPVSLLFKGEEYPLNGEWKNLPVQVCIAIEKVLPGKVHDIVARGEISIMSVWESGFRFRQYVPEAEVWCDETASASESVRQTRKLCKRLGIDLLDLKVIYITRPKIVVQQPTPITEPVDPKVNEPKLVPKPIHVRTLLEQFEADLMESYASGFDFRETSRRLVEGRVGKTMTEAVAKALQARMFERKDGVWLFPQMVMDDAARVKMTARAKELLANEGAFALDALRDEFEGEIRNVPSGADFKRFFNAFVADAVGGRVRGHEGWRVCFAAGTSEAAGWAAIADRVRDVLASAGDALSIADILAQLPHLDREVA